MIYIFHKTIIVLLSLLSLYCSLLSKLTTIESQAFLERVGIPVQYEIAYIWNDDQRDSLYRLADFN